MMAYTKSVLQFHLQQKDQKMEQHSTPKNNVKMPEFRKDPTPPLSQDFFESLDHVDESALARAIVDLELNRPYELPDLRSMFLRRQQMYSSMVSSSLHNYSYQGMRPQGPRNVGMMPRPHQGRPWPVYV